jgi:hypothetical protein
MRLLALPPTGSSPSVTRVDGWWLSAGPATLPRYWSLLSFPSRRGGTLYSRTGDWCAWLCLVLVGACVGVAWRGPSPALRPEGL